MRKLMIVALAFCLGLAACARETSPKDEETSISESSSFVETTETTNMPTLTLTISPTPVPTTSWESEPESVPEAIKTIPDDYIYSDPNIEESVIDTYVLSSYRNFLNRMLENNLVLEENNNHDGSSQDEYEELETEYLDISEVDFAIADIDDDGIVELLVEDSLSRGNVYRFNLETALLDVVYAESFSLYEPFSEIDEVIISKDITFYKLTEDNIESLTYVDDVQGEDIDASIYNETLRIIQDGFDTDGNRGMDKLDFVILQDINNDGFIDLYCGSYYSNIDFSEHIDEDRLYTCDIKGNIVLVSGGLFNNSSYPTNMGYYFNSDGQMVFSTGFEHDRAYEVYDFHNYPTEGIDGNEVYVTPSGDNYYLDGYVWYYSSASPRRMMYYLDSLYYGFTRVDSEEKTLSVYQEDRGFDYLFTYYIYLIVPYDEDLAFEKALEEYEAPLLTEADIQAMCEIEDLGKEIFNYNGDEIGIYELEPPMVFDWKNRYRVS